MKPAEELRGQLHLDAFRRNAWVYARNYRRGQCIDWDTAREAIANMSEAACYIADHIRLHGRVKALVIVSHNGRIDGHAKRFANGLIRFLNAFKNGPPADRYEALMAIQLLDDAAARLSEIPLGQALDRLSVNVELVELDATVEGRGATK